MASHNIHYQYVNIHLFIYLILFVHWNLKLVSNGKIKNFFFNTLNKSTVLLLIILIYFLRF